MRNKSITKKFFVGSASVLLVASAVAPVVSAASFTDVNPGNSHKAAIEGLADLNIISGFQDGSFKPSQTLSRSDVVKLMGKWLVSIGNTVPADYNTNLRFTDFTTNTNDELLQYGALVKDLGVFNGYQDGSLGASGTITRENMAIVLIRAYDQVYNTDLVALVGNQTFTRDVIDLHLAKAEAKPFIDVLDYFDITNPIAPNYRPKETTTRAQFASLLYKAINTDTEMGAVTSLEGTTTVINAMTANQYLTVKANNMDTTVAELVADGYTVDFQSTLAGTIVDITTGELSGSIASGTPFSYKVKIEKDGDVIESPLVTVNVRDYATYISTIVDYSLMQGLTEVNSGKISAADGASTLLVTKATTINGTTVINPPNATFTSTALNIATINPTTGVINPIMTGTTNITVKVDGAVKVIPVNVVADARAAHTVEAIGTAVKLVPTQSKVIDLLVKDQYGDHFQGNLTSASTMSSVATATPTTVPIVNGFGTVMINSLMAGDATVTLSNATDVLKSFTTKVSSDSALDHHKIETVHSSDDFKLDIIKGSSDFDVDLYFNRYNVADFLLGNENTTALTSIYTVTSTNTNVATTAIAGGMITVTGLTPGTTDIIVRQNAVERDRKTITVVDSTPEITNVNFEGVNKITTAGAVSERVLTPVGITLSSTDYLPSISTNGDIYIDDGTAGYNPTADITLGKINVTYSDDPSDFNTLKISGGAVDAINLIPGANGTLIVSVNKVNQSSAFATKQITVQVP